MEFGIQKKSKQLNYRRVF